MKDLIWKDVAGFEGFYKVSENGDVKSLERYDEYTRCDTVCLRHRKEKILTPKLNRGGYLVYHLRDSSRDINSWPTAHRLVALAFVDNVENKPYINHKDGVKTNNHYTNLEWCTAQENTQHAYDTGLAKSVIYRYTKRGEENHNAVLKQEDISEIKRKRATGMTYKAIGSNTECAYQRYLKFAKESLGGLVNKKDVIAPRSLKQKMFIDSDADITIFGGKVVPPCFV